MYGYALYCFAFIGFLLDRLFKDYYITQIPDQGFLFFEKFFTGIGFVSAKNYGIAFSLKIPQFILLILVIVILFFIIYKMIDYRNVGKIFISGSLACIVAGGLSNILDRFLYGGVIDYLKIGLWPIFNIADVLIVGGVLFWAWYLITSNE